jgi:DNA repair exonuclease SbcCD ATPase subunit
MKRVNYQKIEIQNFLSIGKERVTVEFKKGIHIITGVNKDKTDRKNGVGKSTIADAFYFAHFGETIRNIKKELIVNDITNQTATVALEVDVIENGVQDCYKIVRTLKPSRLALYKNSVDITLDSISNTTSFITDLLGLTSSIMVNCVVMTLNDTTPFMAKGKPEKRKFIEDVFDLDMFGRMLTLLKRDFSETKKLVEVKKAQVDEIKRAVMNLKEQHTKLVTLRSERVAHYEKRKADNVLERDKLNEEIKSFVVQDPKDILNSIKKCENAIEMLRKKAKDAVQEGNKSFSKVVVTQSNRVGLIKAMEAGECVECKRSVSR